MIVKRILPERKFFASQKEKGMYSKKQTIFMLHCITLCSDCVAESIRNNPTNGRQRVVREWPTDRSRASPGIFAMESHHPRSEIPGFRSLRVPDQLHIQASAPPRDAFGQRLVAVTLHFIFQSVLTLIPHQFLSLLLLVVVLTMTFVFLRVSILSYFICCFVSVYSTRSDNINWLAENETWKDT